MRRGGEGGRRRRHVRWVPVVAACAAVLGACDTGDHRQAGRQVGYSGVVAGAVPGWLRGRVGGRGFCMVRSRLIGANGIGPVWAVDPSASTLEAERERSPEYLH